MKRHTSNETLVIATFGTRVTLRTPDGSEVSARLKGKKLRPVCGDHVIADPIINESDWLISSIKPRKNELSRPNSRGYKEILAANLDCLIVMAAPEPKPDWFIVDRYLAAAENIGCSAVVAYNKLDRQTSTAQPLAEYRNCGYPVIKCSAKTRRNLDTLTSALAGLNSIIVGQSGVGKSTVINALMENQARATAELSDNTGEGRHTTVNSALLFLPNGGAVIDSPGVRDYAPAIQSVEQAIHGFREISVMGEHCRFANCRHLREPDCSVKTGVTEGTISSRRYQSYKRLVALTRNTISN